MDPRFVGKLRKHAQKERLVPLRQAQNALQFLMNRDNIATGPHVMQYQVHVVDMRALQQRRNILREATYHTAIYPIPPNKCGKFRKLHIEDAIVRPILRTVAKYHDFKALLRGNTPRRLYDPGLGTSHPTLLQARSIPLRKASRRNKAKHRQRIVRAYFSFFHLLHYPKYSKPVSRMVSLFLAGKRALRQQQLRRLSSHICIAKDIRKLHQKQRDKVVR